MRKHLLLLAIFFILTFHVNAQYVTIAPGSWNVGSTWNLGSVPTSASGSITVDHAVTIPSGYSVTIDEVILNSSLVISPGGTITLANGGGNDLTSNIGSFFTINGEFILSNLATLNQTGGVISFGPGSTYRHQYTTTEGAPPIASWNASSNFYIEGFSNSSILELTSSSWNQTYGNFIYDCSSQASIVNFNGLINTIQGDLTILSTGTSATRLTDSEVNVSITVGGNILIAGNSRVIFSVDGTGSSATVTGDFNFTSTSGIGSNLTNNGTFTLNVLGNFIMNTVTGRLYMAGAAGATGVSNINLSQNFSLIAGQLTEGGGDPANGNIRFVGNGSFTFVNTGSIINRINYFIASTVILDLSIYPLAAGSNSNLQLNGTIICGSLEPTGAIRLSTTLGNIRTALRTYSAGSTVIYRSNSPQIMGDGQPTALVGVTTIIDNSQGVTLFQGSVATLAIGDHLRLLNGVLSIGSRTLSLFGQISYGSGSLGGTSSSTLLVGGGGGPSGNFGTLVFNAPNNTLGTLTINRTTGTTVSVNATLNITSQLNLNSGILNHTSGLTIGNGATVTRFGVAQLLGTRLNHALGNSYNLTYRSSGPATTYTTGLELPLATDVTALNNLIVNGGQTSDVFIINQNFSVNGNVTLSRGLLGCNIFTITMQGNNWIDNAGNFFPGSGTVVFNGTTVISGSSNPIFGNIQLNSGHTLSLNRNTSISGNILFQTSTTFNASTFTVTLNGSALQTVSGNGADFFNVTIAKAGGNVQLTSSIDLVNVLQFSNPSTNCNFQSNGFLTLLSTSDAVGSALTPGTAQIYRLLNGNSVSGDVTVQRYMSNEGSIYRYLSSPVTNASVASWQDDFAITGTFSNPNTGSVCGVPMRSFSPSLFYYAEPTAGNVNAGYFGYPASGLAANSLLPVGRGFAAYIRNCTPTVVDVTGPINQGTINFNNLNYTNTGDATADGYNLVGNPYPCTIDWDLSWVKTNISPVISVRNNGNGGVFVYWDGSTGAIANGQIAPGQGFWIRATGASPALRVTENSKAISPNRAGEFFRKPDEVSYLSLSLSDGFITDNTFIKVRPESKNTLDDWDAPKLNNDFFDLYAVSLDSIPMAIDSRHEVSEESQVQLGIKDLEKKNYTLSLNNMTGDFAAYDYILIDRYINKYIPFKGSYEFTVDDNPNSDRSDRFVVKFTALESASAEEIFYPNPVDRYLYINDSNLNSDQIEIFDNVGRNKSVLLFEENGKMVIDFDGYSSGIYYLSIYKAEKVMSFKIIKK